MAIKLLVGSIQTIQGDLQPGQYKLGIKDYGRPIVSNGGFPGFLTALVYVYIYDGIWHKVFNRFIWTVLKKLNGGKDFIPLHTLAPKNPIKICYLFAMNQGKLNS